MDIYTIEYAGSERGTFKIEGPRGYRNEVYAHQLMGVLASLAEGECEFIFSGVAIAYIADDLATTD